MEGLTVIEMKEPVIDTVYCAECGMEINKSSQIEIHLNYHKNK